MKIGWYRRVKRDVTNCHWILAATLQQQYVNSGFTIVNGICACASLAKSSFMSLSSLIADSS
ncbi:MAG: hypothetical protein WA364_25670 [Candidatus Nitrosopolaris sp.]